MATTAPHTLPSTARAGLEPAERALIAAFGSRTTGALATVVDTASRQAPDSLVREALWSLMSHGVITTDSRGNLTLHDVPLQNRRPHGSARSEPTDTESAATA